MGQRREYAYRFVRADQPDYVFMSEHASIGSACGDMCKARNIPGAHRWANGYTVYIIDGEHISGIVVRD